uniref:Uncharacterized protein n=1 Tax=Knipowitschia caucasica TaxID=637954 RepID=A0AAV2J601_KNICA
MPLRWWDCLMPSLLLWAPVALIVVSRPVLGAWTGRALTAVGWTLWRGLCVLLHLPLQKTPPQTSSSGTELLFKPSSLAQHLLRHCGALSRTRLAPWPRGDPHLQTVQSLCGLSTPALQKRITFKCRGRQSTQTLDGLEVGVSSGPRGQSGPGQSPAVTQQVLGQRTRFKQELSPRGGGLWGGLLQG